MVEKVIIIGSGPAAWAAAIYTARAQLQPFVIEGAMTAENQAAGTLPMGQLSLTTEVENYPGFPFGDLETYLASSVDQSRLLALPPHKKEGVSGPELVELMRQQAINFGTRTLPEDVVNLDVTAKPFRLSVSDGVTYEAQSIIVATGAKANYLGLESENRFKNRGVSACAVCDGALPRFRNKNLIVVGGGDSAIEEADYLTKFAQKVYLVHRRDQLRASKIMARRAMEHEKIEILWNRTLTEVLGDDQSGVTGAVLKSTVGENDLRLDVTGVFLGIGHTPNTAFLKGKLDLTDKGYIVRPVPFRCHTSVAGIFTAGDVADDYYRQAITAAGTGCMAALDAERYLAALE
ncbi:MAG: FAD-dependent oxidoreductase [Planctomycetaceae bacterium]|jgi:thioredoxin reductase (NADPH)|nr:FAD-dependent oxidoreductase [Planctomycetaceae bacterium]